MYVLIYCIKKLYRMWKENQEYNEQQEQLSRQEAAMAEERQQEREAAIRKRMNRIADDKDVEGEKQCRICHETEWEDPSKKLIRPCLCTGSLLYVHVECLNAWRATSNEASYKCSVCGYNYDVRRNNISKVILSDTFANIVTSVLTLLIDILLGLMLIYLDTHYIHLKPDLSTMLMVDLLDFQLWWRHPRPFMDVFKFDEDWSWTRLFQNSAISNSVDVFMVGSTFVSLIGAVICAYNEARRLYEDGFDAPHRLGVFFSWVGHALVSRRILRIPILLGHAAVTRAYMCALYEFIHRHARYLGEYILEPHRTVILSAENGNKAKRD